MKGIVIIGHGSRSVDAQKEFMEVVDKVKERTDMTVEGAFMELAKPDFFDVVENLAAKGVDEITVYPLFLFTGIHIKEDIPGMIDEAAAKYPNIKFNMLQPIGPREAIVQIVLDEIKE